jgi:hypothetical protein
MFRELLFAKHALEWFSKGVARFSDENRSK